MKDKGDEGRRTTTVIKSRRLWNYRLSVLTVMTIVTNRLLETLSSNKVTNKRT